MEFLFHATSPEEQRREKNLARDLRKSQWWKNQLGRGRCHYCEQRFSPALLTLDHKIPIARGGKTSKSNCVPACKECNSKKGHHLPVELVMKELP